MKAMANISLGTGLLLAAILFVIGLIGVLARKNIIFILMSVEVMLNAAGLAFVIAGASWSQPDGQVMFIFILTMAAAEVSVGLALILQIHKKYKSLDSDELDQMKG
jgi:NADH-quinone oxidoreductase subunit K